jgi:hypothetical protein
MISGQTRSAFVARENRFPLFRIMLYAPLMLRLTGGANYSFGAPSSLPVDRLIDEVKPAASLADRGFVAAVRIVRRGIVRQPVLHVHPGPRTFEDDIAHNAYLASGAVLRLDPCQCQSVQPVQAGLRPDG